MPFEGDSVGHSVVFDALNVSILFQSVLDSSKLIPVIMEDWEKVSGLVNANSVPIYTFTDSLILDPNRCHTDIMLVSSRNWSNRL